MKRIIWSLYTFTVNGVRHGYCRECIDMDYARAVADSGIGTQAYGTCEACADHEPSSGPYRYVAVQTNN